MSTETYTITPSTDHRGRIEGYYLEGAKFTDYFFTKAEAEAKRDELIAQQAVATEPLATEKQVAYALTLARRNAAGSLDLSADSLRKMTRREISRAIDSLKAEW